MSSRNHILRSVPCCLKCAYYRDFWLLPNANQENSVTSTRFTCAFDETSKEHFVSTSDIDLSQ
jgi:hypothetical protein